MSKTHKFLVVLSTLMVSQLLLAQNNNNDPAAGCAACGGCAPACGGCGCYIVFIIALIALHVALLVWVARDAKARGLDDTLLWGILVMFTGLIGLLIYMVGRPRGNLIQCPSCQGKRLEASAKCPQCGNA
jgi:hypothetical protein